MIKVKATVKPKSLVIMAACANVAEELGLSILVTSGNDSKHMTNSLHYKDQALDIRSKNFDNSSLKFTFMAKVLERLGKSYEGLLEDENGPNEHFHFEFDVK